MVRPSPPEDPPHSSSRRENTKKALTCPHNYKFTGKERDSESGLDDFEARYYSSQFGRFHSADWSAIPVPYADLGNPQTLNLYAYVKNNPLNPTDPTGLGGFHIGTGDARTMQLGGGVICPLAPRTGSYDTRTT